MSNQQITIERLARQPIVSIRGRTSLADAPAFFDRSYATLFAHLAAYGGRLAGPALSCTHEKARDTLDVEVALPLEAPIPGAGEIVAGEVPPVEAAVTDHVGSYSAVAETYTALEEFVRRKGREAAGIGYEFYVDNPAEVPVENRRTRIALVLRE